MITYSTEITSHTEYMLTNQEKTSTDVNTTYSCADEHYYSTVEDVITRYGFGLVFFVGGLGNLVSLVVLQHKEFRLTSMRFTLSALAVVDTGLLVFGLLRQWLWELMSHDPRSQNRFLCKTMHFGIYFFGQLSPWTIVLLTLERVVSIYKPLKARTLCSTRRVVVTWLLMAAMLFAINSHLLWRADLRHITHTYYSDDVDQYERCSPDHRPPNATVVREWRCLTCDSWDSVTNLAWLWIDLILVCFLPSTIVVVGNAIIIIKLCRVKTERQNLQTTISCRESPHFSTNVMLVSVSAWFLLTTSPLQLFLLFATPDGSSYGDVQLAICNLLYYLNSSTNFALYCLTGSIFRKAFVATFRRTGSTTSLKHNSASSAHASFRLKTDIGNTLLSEKVTMPLKYGPFSPSLVSLPLNGTDCVVEY